MTGTDEATLTAPGEAGAPTRRDRLRGVLVGTAVGDALGLPAEGLSRRRARKLFHGRWRHRFFFRRGMTSDDTEHTFLVAQCLMASAGSVEGFARRLSWCLRWWLLAMPAGVGWATLRAIARLWVGYRPSNSGVLSAGNGPAMRSAVVGAYLADARADLDVFVRASTTITHTDHRAVVGAMAVAKLTAWIVRDNLTRRPGVEEFLSLLTSCATDDEEWNGILASMRDALDRELTVGEFADALGLAKGVSGYMFHTVPVAAYAWFRHFGDFEGALTAILGCGGDTDTTAAIVGALAGATVGERAIPRDWLCGVIEWPRTMELLRRLGDALTEHEAHVRYFWPGCLVRNVVFLTLVLFHGFRRLLPPY